jgi:hypothetical protein
MTGNSLASFGIILSLSPYLIMKKGVRTWTPPYPFLRWLIGPPSAIMAKVSMAKSFWIFVARKALVAGSPPSVTRAFVFVVVITCR